MPTVANAKLREQLGGTQAALRAKEAEFDALAQERDRLAKRLADQEESHKAALKAVQDSEAALQAEYETEAASWAEAKQMLINGYGQIEDLVDGRPPSSSSLACRLPFGSFSDLVFFSSFSFFLAQSTSLATLLPPTRSSRPTARHKGRLGPRSRRTLAGRWRNSSWRLKPASSRLTACSAGFSVLGRRCWPLLGPGP